jgi:Uma2 family endonuclease
MGDNGMIPSADITFLLAPGDRMGLEEFLERWEQSPDLKFAELIDGVVYMPSPVSVPHIRLDGRAHSVLGHFALCSGVCELFPNATWILRGSAPQPDVALSLNPEYGGKMEIGPRELASGFPELVVEVCRSSRSYDLGPKLALYERAGVPEYLAILIEERRFEWRILDQGRYRLIEASDGIFRSRILPGLWIDEPAFWRGDSPRLLAVVDQGLNSAEFLEFKRHKKL